MAVDQPRIPETWLDVPSQRLYYLSLGLLLLATKVVDIFRYLTASPDASFCRKWLIIDTLYCLTLSYLRIPRLRYSRAVVSLQILLLGLLNSLLFGGIQLRLFGDSGLAGALNLNVFTPLTFGLLRSSEFSPFNDPHLSGQHTVLLSPISTAQLNPSALTFCLSPPQNFVLIPILLNNTNPIALRYSTTPLGDHKDGDQTENVDLSARELKAIEKARLDALQLARPSSPERDQDYDEYDDEDSDSLVHASSPHSALQKSQSVIHLKVSKPGRIRLERLLDSSNTESRIRHSPDVIVAPCPSVAFVQGNHDKDNIRCAGEDPQAELMLDISGVPPLSLRWYKSINGRKESYLVEGIENEQDATKPGPISRKGVPQKFRVPLSVSLDATGRHVYALEEVMDLIGNIVRVNTTGSVKNSEVIRTFQVLQRPTMSFKHCGPDKPTFMLIGSEAPLAIGANTADDHDSPWEAVVKYHPPASEGDDKMHKKLKPWKKTLSTQDNSKDVTLRVNAPGTYTIASVKGKWCTGDVLAPETCKVVERPRPSAEIEWKKIHECSGDTGVSATLVLHGTPPFHVQYKTQRDTEAPRELSKTFTTSRGELTIQPERSGHYKFMFTRVNDMYYGVDLNGPSIDQVVHPLASADFVGHTGGMKKKLISSCEGGAVSVDVELRGTPPWNLDVQVVGLSSSDIVSFPAINTPRTTLQIPIPKKIDKEGGTFEIDLVSVEDRSKCRRTLSVPGITVNVRRIKPTAKFYGEKNKRTVGVLEREEVHLPLRLTGDGPWRIKYHRKEVDNVILTATLTHPNDHLRVREKGLYELLEVSDSQCPGSIVNDSSTYVVDWIPRPSAKLSESTKAEYEVLNGSYILPPICEHVDDQVDLDLEGRPPFQIMYNIAQDNENGGTRLLDQPTFNSIQKRTKFQLQTMYPGRVYYEVKQIGDAAYPLAQHKNAIIPRSERLLFEQQVSMLPSARFETRTRLLYCLNDAFVPIDATSNDGVVVFEGTPPFRLQMSIKNIISSQADPVTIETNQYVWKINLPSYKFTSVGPHHIRIESVSDASHCRHAALDPLATSIWVDVAETAAIIPFDRRDHFCVGEVAQFQLEGIPPWTIGYRVNGKSHSQEAKVSPFSLALHNPGEFSIASISHQNKLCKAVVTDLQFAVHALPSAQVGHGKRIYQDIHEGDQAEIVFTLIGEPPFTFTYQRAEPAAKKGGRPGKVLETHTVSRVFSREYSIYSALEGTWTVTSIADKYCRYPPAPEGT